MILALFINSSPIFQTWCMLSIVFLAYFKHFGHNNLFTSCKKIVSSLFQCSNMKNPTFCRHKTFISWPIFKLVQVKLRTYGFLNIGKEYAQKLVCN